MPQCVSCPKKQAVLNAGNLCKSCFDKNGAQETEEANAEEEAFNDEELDKPIHLATLRDLSNVVKKITDPILKRVEKLINPIKEKANANASKIALLEASLIEKETKIEALSQIIVNMQASLNSVDASKRTTNIIISGLSEGDIECEGGVLTNDDEKVKCLFDILEIPPDTANPPVQFEVSRIGAPRNNATRLIKVDLKSKVRRDAVLQKASSLKNRQEPWKKVYVKKDLHPVYTKENQRIYAKMKNLRRDNPDKDIKILKGALLVDGKKVDSNSFFV